MNVSEFFASQESTLAQRAMADSNAQRRLDWENRLLRQSQLLWGMERRAAALCGPSEIVKMGEAIRPRPFVDDLISKMEEQSRGIQRLADSNRSTIMGAALESMKIGEVYRRLIEPIPALKTVLQPPIEPFFSTMFESARALKPLVELQHRIGILTSNSVSQATQIGSTIADTFKNISRVVELARPAYVENPFFGTESAFGEFSDLNAVVEYGRQNFASPDFPAEMNAILREILRENQALRADLAADRAKQKWAKRIILWATVIGLLLHIADSYRKNVSGQGECKCPPQVKQLPSPPPVKFDSDNVGPCP